MKTLLVAAMTHGRVLVDDGPAGPLRLLVGFHGYAQSAEEMLLELRTIDAAGWTRLSVQALNRFYRGRTHETVANWMTRQDREQQIADNVAYVDAAIDAVARGGDVKSIVYCGFSQGVAMAFRAALLGARSCDAVLALGGDVPPDLLAGAPREFPHVLLAAGTQDHFYPCPKLESDVAALRASGVDVTAVVFDGGHEWHDTFRREAARLLHDLWSSFEECDL